MSVRKREWGAPHDRRLAWVVDYADSAGKRRHRTFRTKGEADGFAAQTKVDLRKGIHVADGASTTVTKAAELWLKHCAKPIDTEPLELTTLDQYRQHVELHILPFLGHVKLSRLTVPSVTHFQEQLRTDENKARSPAMVRRVTRSLGSLLAHAQARGLVAQNVVSELRAQRKKGRGKKQDRHNGKLKVGVDIPTPEEIRQLLAVATGRWKPLLMTAALTGLRASELRGLVWDDVDLNKGVLHVRQRADRYNKIGPPKSAAGDRRLPLTPALVQVLTEWKLQCPRSEGEAQYLVFPTSRGKIITHASMIHNGLLPTMLKAGIVGRVRDEDGKPMRDEDGKPMVEAKYTGLHCLRHFFASWCINRRKDGGCELPPKIVQTRLGHSTMAMTMDTYGHLFEGGDDSAELAAAEEALLGLQR